jgi:urea carboxylase
VLVSHWEIGALYGPHGAPDFFTESDVATLFEAEYEVHFNSARTGVRLIGPRPEWARADGGEAGLHPSNLHDNAYAVGTLDFTGDMPILLGPDGPSLGGFVCPLTVVQAELWKLGQLRPGDRVRFRRLDRERARVLREEQDRAMATLRTATKQCAPVPKAESPILLQTSGGGFEIVLRQAGEDCLLVEIGDAVLDLTLRLQVHVLMERIRAAAPAGLIDLTPGIRSLQLHFDGRVLSVDEACALVRREAETLSPVDRLEVPSRIVHLPLSWNDGAIQLAVRKYHELVRPDAPWCPSNIEFIRRINGLADEAAVRETVFSASYLVLGLGDVYLGAPVATPLDPRHRLVTTKYNPARTWTPENAVGIGGAYLCIYGMEGPGGYQLFGRTLQVWNTRRQTASFVDGRPWLLRFFDQIRFFPVEAAELADAREAFLHGAYPVRIEESTFSFAAYQAFLEENAESIAAFRNRQREAFLAERERWRESGLATFVADDGGPADLGANDALPGGHAAACAAVPGNVWKVLVAAGDRVAAGQVVVLLESMKMEMEVTAPVDGVVQEVSCRVGRTVAQGQRLLSIEVA